MFRLFLLHKDVFLWKKMQERRKHDVHYLELLKKQEQQQQRKHFKILGWKKLQHMSIKNLFHGLQVPEKNYKESNAKTIKLLTFTLRRKLGTACCFSE